MKGLKHLLEEGHKEEEIRALTYVSKVRKPKKVLSKADLAVVNVYVDGLLAVLGNLVERRLSLSEEDPAKDIGSSELNVLVGEITEYAYGLACRLSSERPSRFVAQLLGEK